MIHNIDLIEKQLKKFQKLGYISQKERVDDNGFKLIVAPRVPAVTNWNIFRDSLKNTYADYYHSIQVVKCNENDESYSYFVIYKFKEKTKTVTYKRLIQDRLQTMEIGDKFSAKDFITEYWGYYDYFVRRTFDVFFTQAKKQIAIDRKEGEPVKVFKCKYGEINRFS